MANKKKKKEKKGGRKAESKPEPAAAGGLEDGPASPETFRKFVFGLVSFQQVAFWFYSDCNWKNHEARAKRVVRIIERAERDLMSLCPDPRTAGDCPRTWVDCGGFCMPPGSVCE